MSDTSFETDEFLKLLTDALRAGPASPSWHEAVAKLRARGEQDADELRLLTAVRQHLESGREYRSVRAGPGFTRKVMESIEQEAAQPPKSLPTATLIAIGAGVLILGVIVTVLVMVLRNPGGDAKVPDALRNGVFTKEILTSDFADVAPAGWRAFGDLPIKSQGGLRTALPKDFKSESFQGGGLVLAQPIPASQMFEASATVHVERSTENLLVQLFVTDDPTFPKSPEATNPEHELVLWIQGGQARVGGLPDKTVKHQKLSGGDKTLLRIKMDRQFVIVEADGKTLYEGKHTLSADRARHVGIRFQAKSPEKHDSIVVQSVRILKP